MSATLRDVMRRVAFWLEPSDTFLAGSTTALGTQVTLIDLFNLADGYRGSIYEGAWIRFADNSVVANQRYRRVITGGDDPTAGTLTFLPALSVAVPSATTYELWTHYAPWAVADAVNVALGRMTYVTEDPLTVVADQLNYPLATDLPWVTSEEQIFAVRTQAGSVTNEYRYADRNGVWALREDAGAFWLDFSTSFTVSTDTVLLVKTLRSYASKDGVLSLSQDATTAPLDWVAIETCLVLAEQHEGQADADPRDVGYWTKRARAWRNAAAPKAKRQMFAHALAQPGPSGAGRW